MCGQCTLLNSLHGFVVYLLHAVIGSCRVWSCLWMYCSYASIHPTDTTYWNEILILTVIHNFLLSTSAHRTPPPQQSAHRSCPFFQSSDDTWTCAKVTQSSTFCSIHMHTILDLSFYRLGTPEDWIPAIFCSNPCRNHRHTYHFLYYIVHIRLFYQMRVRGFVRRKNPTGQTVIEDCTRAADYEKLHPNWI